MLAGYDEHRAPAAVGENGGQEVIVEDAVDSERQRNQRKESSRHSFLGREPSAFVWSEAKAGCRLIVAAEALSLLPPSSMGVKSLWDLLAPVGRPVMYASKPRPPSPWLTHVQARDNGGQDHGHRL